MFCRGSLVDLLHLRRATLFRHSGNIRKSLVLLTIVLMVSLEVSVVQYGAMENLDGVYIYLPLSCLPPVTRFWILGNA